MKLNLRRKLSFLVMIFLLFIVVCCSSVDDRPQYDPPSDHTINKDGVMHKNGLADPALNCTGCHGDDLKGGTSQVSCYECHGVEW
ncbi:MAG: hypothetical protein KAS29_02490 [Bacteroidales bacterium]|nr:hypothetical protein [Bacteroidales bacterium]